MKVGGYFVSVIIIGILLVGIFDLRFVSTKHQFDVAFLAIILIFGIPWAALSKKETFNAANSLLERNTFESFSRPMKFVIVIGSVVILYVFWFVLDKNK